MYPIVKVESIIQHYRMYPEKAFYVKNGHFVKNGPVMIVPDPSKPEDDIYLDTEVPINGFNFALTDIEFEDVMENLRQQVVNPSFDLCIMALNHYIDMDGFIDVEFMCRIQVDPKPDLWGHIWEGYLQKKK